jgi:hypothetical protein
MAKVRLLTSMAGIDFSHNKGDVIDCADETPHATLRQALPRVSLMQKPRLNAPSKRPLLRKP